MPKRAKKSEVKPQERKPVSIEEARDALLLAAGAWVAVVDGTFTSFDPLQAFDKHACTLHDYQMQLIDWDSFSSDPRAADSVLDHPSGWHRSTCLELIGVIHASAAKHLERCKTIDELRAKVREDGLPSSYIEAKAFLGVITEAMTTPPKRVDESRLVFDVSDFDMDRSTVSRRAKDHARFGDGILQASRGQYAVRKELVADFIKPTRQDKGRPFYP